MLVDVFLTSSVHCPSRPLEQVRCHNKLPGPLSCIFNVDIDAVIDNDNNTNVIVITNNNICTGAFRCDACDGVCALNELCALCSQ